VSSGCKSIDTDMPGQTPMMTQQAFHGHFKDPRPRLAPEKNGSKDDGVLVKLIARRKDQRYRPPMCPGAEFS